MAPSDSYNLYAVQHHSLNVTGHSGMAPLAASVGATTVTYEETWRRVMRRSWSVGEMVRRWGVWCSGSDLNTWLPFWHERRVRLAMRGPAVAHFFWGEMAAPRYPLAFHRRGIALVGTYHASQWRQQRALARYQGFDVFDQIILMSVSQRAFFLDRGYPVERIHIIPHGIDIRFFRPPEVFIPAAGRAVQGLLVGTTERDHRFMVEVLKRLPPGTLSLKVATMAGEAGLYRQFPQVQLLDRVSDHDLTRLYQQADLLIMPMIDCTANNSILEAMACGTPVLTNRVGGTPEYVNPACCVLTNDKNVYEWVEILTQFAQNRSLLWARRPAVREWAEELRWEVIADRHRMVYDAAFSSLCAR